MNKQLRIWLFALLGTLLATSSLLAEGVITFTTAKAVGETVMLKMTYTGDAPTLSGATGTPISGTEVTYTLTSQTVTITGDVTGLNCNENQLTALDVSKNTALRSLVCSYNQLTALDLSHNTELTELYCFKNQLTALDVSKNTALTRLSCPDNQLTTLDLSQNTELTMLYCYNNQLTALDVSKNTALIWLDCNNNQLKALDVSKNIALTNLGCYNNKLTALNVSQNTSLTGLYCYNNQLKALDVSKNKNTELSVLNCSGNQIKGEEMTRLVNSLPDLTGKDAGRFIVVQEPAPESNICLQSDVAIAKGKNWITLKYKSDTNKSVAYEGADNTGVETTVTQQVKLYPNPATDYVIVEGVAPASEVTLHGLTGERLYTGRADSRGVLQIDLTPYADGVYLVCVAGETYRIVVRR